MRGSNFWFRNGGLARKVFPLFFVLCLVMGAAFFTGCKDDLELLPDPPVGTWVSAYGEEYTITEDEFISSYEGDVGYKGDIVNIREDGAGAGYITIKYTANAWNEPAVGNYYVIRWKDKEDTSIDISGAGKAPDFGDGKPTQAEAEAEYTNGNDYFAIYSTCAKQE
jgi:hypothetical protein